jgi:hypothetical protein
MTPRELEEYRALRATIRERGTTRAWVVLAGLVAWALAAIATVALIAPPIVTLIPLLVLIATFEVAFSLHVGAERIGRYIQVFFEDETTGPGWEHRIMSFGRVLPGVSDPLFAWCFWIAAIANVIPAMLSEPPPAPIEWAFLGLGHAMFVARVALGRRRAAGQRVADLARFRELRRGPA